MHLCGQRKRGREKCFIVLACFDTIYSQVLVLFVFFAVSGGLKISPCESFFFFLVSSLKHSDDLALCNIKHSACALNWLGMYDPRQCARN